MLKNITSDAEIAILHLRGVGDTLDALAADPEMEARWQRILIAQAAHIETHTKTLRAVINA